MNLPRLRLDLRHRIVRPGARARRRSPDRPLQEHRRPADALEEHDRFDVRLTLPAGQRSSAIHFDAGVTEAAARELGFFLGAIGPLPVRWVTHRDGARFTSFQATRLAVAHPREPQALARQLLTPSARASKP